MRSLYFETLLIALAVLLLEVSYTRVFSFKLVYYFAYLVIGIAMLGLGAGGVFVAIFARLRRIPIERLIPWCGVAAAATVALGYFLVAYLRLNLFELINAKKKPPSILHPQSKVPSFGTLYYTIDKPTHSQCSCGSPVHNRYRRPCTSQFKMSIGNPLCVRSEWWSSCQRRQVAERTQIGT